MSHQSISLSLLYQILPMVECCSDCKFKQLQLAPALQDIVAGLVAQETRMIHRNYGNRIKAFLLIFLDIAYLSLHHNGVQRFTIRNQIGSTIRIFHNTWNIIQFFQFLLHIRWNSLIINAIFTAHNNTFLRCAYRQNHTEFLISRLEELLSLAVLAFIVSSHSLGSSIRITPLSKQRTSKKRPSKITNKHLITNKLKF